MTALAAGLAALLLAAVAAFQAALALGAPFGAYAWGGKHDGPLPERLRFGSAISAPLLLGMAAIILVRGGIIWPTFQPAAVWAVWAIFLFMVINTVANWRSESPKERRVMTPLTLAIAVAILVLQLSP